VQVVFEVDASLAAQLKDAKFQFVAKPTAEGEQDAADDNQGTQTGGNTGTNNPPSGDLEP
jgi:hypothetical protein